MTTPAEHHCAHCCPQSACTCPMGKSMTDTTEAKVSEALTQIMANVRNLGVEDYRLIFGSDADAAPFLLAELRRARAVIAAISDLCEFRPFDDSATATRVYIRERLQKYYKGE